MVWLDTCISMHKRPGDLLQGPMFQFVHQFTKIQAQLPPFQGTDPYSRPADSRDSSSSNQQRQPPEKKYIFLHFCEMFCFI